MIIQLQYIAVFTTQITFDKTQSETNDGSQGTERTDSARDKSNASLAQMAQVPTTKMVVLELIQSQVKIPKWMQWKVVL
jgi:hypothetical protein